MRCHTVPHHGSYSVAEHSWHATILLYQLHPDPSPALIRAMLTHDVAERFLGDLPAQAKWENPDLDLAYHMVEKRVMANLGEPLVGLKPDEQIWLYAIDKLECFLWCQDQRAMGNQHTQPMMQLLWEWFEKAGEGLPHSIREFLETYKWSRSNEIV